MSVLKAIAGKVKITPEEIAPLQGYDPEVFIADPEKDILDDLYAKVLILESDSVRIVFVSVDCGLTNEDRGMVPNPSGEANSYREFINTFPKGTRKRWAEAADVPEASLSVNCTHTHSAPAHFSEKYTERVRVLIQQLAAKLEPVTVKLYTGECSIAVNRRPRLKPNYEIPIDRSLYVVMFESLGGKPIACIVNCAVHPTIIWNRPNRVSSEMVGLAMNQFEEQMGDGFIALFIQGFSGDVCPIYSGHSGGKEDTYPLSQQAARELYSDVLGALEHQTEITPMPFKTAQKVISLPVRDWIFKPTFDITMVSVVLGDLLIMSVSAEVFNGYIAKIKDRSPFKHHIFAGVANGYSGYLPTVEAFDDQMGGYEMNTTPYNREAEQLFLNEVSIYLQSLKQQ
jgi:hypothetical protein